MSNIHIYLPGDLFELVNIEHPEGGEYVPSKSDKVGNTGKIVAVHNNMMLTACNIRVHWDNGSRNSYHVGNLRPILDTDRIYKDEGYGDIHCR